MGAERLTVWFNTLLFIVAVVGAVAGLVSLSRGIGCKGNCMQLALLVMMLIYALFATVTNLSWIASGSFNNFTSTAEEKAEMVTHWIIANAYIRAAHCADLVLDPLPHLNEQSK